MGRQNRFPAASHVSSMSHSSPSPQQMTMYLGTAVTCTPSNCAPATSAGLKVLFGKHVFRTVTESLDGQINERTRTHWLRRPATEIDEVASVVGHMVDKDGNQLPRPDVRRRRYACELPQHLACQDSLELEQLVVAADRRHNGLVGRLIAKLHSPRQNLTRAWVAIGAAAMRGKVSEGTRHAVLLEIRRCAADGQLHRKQPPRDDALMG